VIASLQPTAFRVDANGALPLQVLDVTARADLRAPTARVPEDSLYVPKVRVVDASGSPRPEDDSANLRQ